MWCFVVTRRIEPKFASLWSQFVQHRCKYMYTGTSLQLHMLSSCPSVHRCHLASQVQRLTFFDCTVCVHKVFLHDTGAKQRSLRTAHVFRFITLFMALPSAKIRDLALQELRKVIEQADRQKTGVSFCQVELQWKGWLWRIQAARSSVRGRFQSAIWTTHSQRVVSKSCKARCIRVIVQQVASPSNPPWFQSNIAEQTTLIVVVLTCLFGASQNANLSIPQQVFCTGNLFYSWIPACYLPNFQQTEIVPNTFDTRCFC